MALVREFLQREWQVVAFGRRMTRDRFLAQLGLADIGIRSQHLLYRRVPDISRTRIDALVRSCDLPLHQHRTYVNAVGRCFYAPFLSASTKDFQRMIQSNLGVTFNILRHVCRVARRVPTTSFLYVEIGSRAGADVSHARFSLYAMVKQGQLGLLRALASELRETRCTLTVVTVPGVRTRLYDRSLGDRTALRHKFEHGSDLLLPAHVAEAITERIERWIDTERESAGPFEHWTL
jgi:NAD(P)-dependent dehydrogenase (short-subunit alcohol dehydrogenase family)